MSSAPPPSRALISEIPLQHRAVSLEFLLDFTWEHNCWEKPTHEVVADIIIPFTRATGTPYIGIIDDEQFGSVDVFMSHAWTNPFGLLVAAARKFVSDRNAKSEERAVHFVWVDIFAITQHGGLFQSNELAQLEQTVDLADTTLVILDERAAPLTRIWCIFEIYCSLRDGIYGKLKVRVGNVSSMGEFLPCVDGDVLRAIAEVADITQSKATVLKDKEIILKRIQDMRDERDDRHGILEVNRKIKRAVRQGWV